MAAAVKGKLRTIADIVRVLEYFENGRTFVPGRLSATRQIASKVATASSSRASEIHERANPR